MVLAILLPLLCTCAFIALQRRRAESKEGALRAEISKLEVRLGNQESMARRLRRDHQILRTAVISHTGVNKRILDQLKNDMERQTFH